MFEPWQGPALTTILHRQKLEYMRNLSRHIFSTMPGRTHFNYHVQLAACSPNRWVGSYVQQHPTPITPLSRENRRPSFWSFHFGYSDNYLYLIIFSLILNPRPSYILKPHVGIEPTSLAWKANILNRYTNGTNAKHLGLRCFYTFLFACKNF